MPKLLRLGGVRCVVLCLVSCIPAALADNYPRQPAIHAQHYTFRIALSAADDKVAREATLDLRFLQAGITQVALDLTSLKDGKAMTGAAVSFHVPALPFEHFAHH